MELKGNVFLNVTLSFWTNPQSHGSSHNNTFLNTTLAHKSLSTPTRSSSSVSGTKVDETHNDPNLSLNTSTTGKAVFNDNLLNLLWIKKDNLSDATADDTPNTELDFGIINRNASRKNIADSLHLSRPTHDNVSNHGSILDSSFVDNSKLITSHYQDASLVHSAVWPSPKSINDAYTANNQTDITPSGLSLWNSTFYSGSQNWTNILYLDNSTVLERFDCFDNGLSKHDGCILHQSNGTANFTTELDPLFDQRERDYWALFLIILPILALFGNILVILSVYRERSLQTVTNWFIVSLAFADLFVTIPMLFSLYVMVNVDWELSELVCDLYIAIDVICSTASIFNLVAISFDRYIAVTHPIFYSKHKNDKRVIVTIILVWMASSGVGLPIMLGANTSPERIPELCIFYNSDFIIYSSLWSFYVPCLIMVILYYKIFKAIHDRARKKMDSTKSKTNNAANSQNNAKFNTSSINAGQVKAHAQTLENISLSKQIQMKAGIASKLEQIKMPTEGRNHTQTSVALISEINLATATDNNHNTNSNNTESHLEDEEDEDDDDLEEEAEEVEIKDLNCKCSTRFTSNANCNCSIYTNSSDRLNNNNNNTTNLKNDFGSVPYDSEICRHMICQNAAPDSVIDVEKHDNNLNGSNMFFVESASTSFNMHPVNRNNLPSRKESNLINNQNSHANTGSSSASTSTGNNNNNNPSSKTANSFHRRSQHEQEDEEEGKNGTNGNENAVHNDSPSAAKYSKKKSRFNLGRKHRSSRKKREKASAKRERKATKTLAIVLGVFLLCWTPFFSCNILDAICIKLHENHFIQSDCRPGMTAFLLTTWLGYMNSCANPLIYTIFNPEFRKAFRKILCQF